MYDKCMKQFEFYNILCTNQYDIKSYVKKLDGAWYFQKDKAESWYNDIYLAGKPAGKYRDHREKLKCSWMRRMARDMKFTAEEIEVLEVQFLKLIGLSPTTVDAPTIEWLKLKKAGGSLE